MLDHSVIYRSQRFVHWHHKVRLRQIVGEVSRFRDASSVADIGCSNGYVTNLLSEVCAGEIYGFDYLPECIESARSTYSHIDFQRADLNRQVKWGRTFELVCCFETLEHVGNLPAALDNVFAAIQDKGRLIVSVPVEIGLWGLTKYCLKTLSGYSMEEIDAGRGEYFLALVLDRDISRFRKESYTWGTHYGFDWRVLEERISTEMHIEKAYTKFATRIIVARKTK
jgi:2-polyprenyl-3-methyl-5-hydroxy-6-metoxy-1,4-benzoquinol methylase